MTFSSFQFDPSDRRQKFRDGWLPKTCLLILAALVFGTLPVINASGQIPELEIREGTGIPADVRTIYERGTRFLQSIQKEDGSFGNDAGFHGNESAGIAGLSVMAWLSTGQDPNFGEYADNIRKSLRYIIQSQNPKNGYIPGNMYVHGFAMLALAEAYGAVDDDMLWAGYQDHPQKRTIGESLELAVKLAVASQKKNPHKGWRYSPNERSADTSVVGAVLMGLLAARNAGIAVPDESIDGALDYMKSMTDSKSGMVGYSGLGGFGDSTARSSIACLVFAIGKRKELEEFVASSKYVAENLEGQGMGGGWPFYTRYYLAQALFQSDYETWEKWNKDTIRRLRDSQGSNGQIGQSEHGPAYSTSMSLLALALNYRFLPIYEK